MNNLYFRENVLIDSKGHIKICDFGSSKQLDSSGKNTPYIVSRYYRAPELILCITKYTGAIDIWGIIQKAELIKFAFFNLINFTML